VSRNNAPTASAAIDNVLVFGSLAMLTVDHEAAVIRIRSRDRPTVGNVLANCYRSIPTKIQACVPFSLSLREASMSAHDWQRV
jgi:hypothetical protein